MSYILDALRRSQAERERGHVPGLDARPAAVAAVPAGPPGQRWRQAAALAAVLLVVALALLWWWRASSPPATVDVAAPAPAPVPEPRPETVAAPAPSPLPVVVSAPPAPRAAPALAAAPVAGPAATASTATAPSAAGVTAPTPLAALTPAQRRELPSLVMGGSIWSDNALSRFVIVNGQVVREGETAAPGVVVERIEPKAVLLRWRELRLEVPL